MCRFPTEPTVRKAWLVALGKDNWSPRESTAVCSTHFAPEDMYETPGGVRKVRPGAVPVLQLVCRICLDTESRLVNMVHYKLDEAFQHLTGIMVYGDSLPQQLCMECAHRLLNCDSFRRKSLRAHELMMDIIDKEAALTIDSLKSIDRSNNSLATPLRIKHFEVDKYDYEVEFVEKTEEELKHENNLEIFLPAVPDEVIVKDEVEDTVQFDDNNYSTDDSLPLEVQRRKKKKEKKQAKRVEKKAEPAEPKIDRRRRPLLNSDLSETLFTITDLTYEEQVAEIEKRQESSNYRNAVFKCTECYKGFLDEDAYSAHMMRHTDECGLHRCNICKTRFAQRHALRKHVTAHHTQRYSCTACAFVTTHRQTARLHERWHRGTRYRCPHCPDEFVKFTTYMGHIRIKHPSDFVCALCGYSFVSQKGLDMHRKLKHRGGGAGGAGDGAVEVPADGPACERCDVQFASVDAYRRHLSVSARHTDDPAACSWRTLARTTATSGARTPTRTAPTTPPCARPPCARSADACSRAKPSSAITGGRTRASGRSRASRAANGSACGSASSPTAACTRRAASTRAGSAGRRSALRAIASGTCSSIRASSRSSARCAASASSTPARSARTSHTFTSKSRGRSARAPSARVPARRRPRARRSSCGTSSTCRPPRPRPLTSPSTITSRYSDMCERDSGRERDGAHVGKARSAARPL
ncbi:zinc finger protein 41-like isoform X2 [Aricia agestis]|uniref:zinc finger protein 41-like isoform X2 n=1 Tax=Aricia agestis TaxID=91739 RepID=UPI001C20181E|nr:zinc finger protein 41-like isoform X2 [Aricia agestis]